MDLDNRDWHYAKDGEQLGPIPFTQLKAMVENGALPPSSLIWSEGMGNWESYHKVMASNISLPATAQPETETTGNAVIDDLSALPVSQEELSATHSIGLGWNLTLEKFGLLIGYGALYIVFSIALSLLVQVPAGIAQYACIRAFGAENIATISVQLLFAIIGQIASIFLGLGLIRVAMNIVGGEYISPGTFFTQADKLWSAVLASILYSLMVIIGLCLLIVPGIYLGIRYSQFMNAIVDRNLRPLEALQYSADLTKDRIMSLLGFYILTMLISLAGILCLFIGLLWAIPCVTLAQIFIYRSMQGGYPLITALAQKRSGPAPLTPGIAGR